MGQVIVIGDVILDKTTTVRVRGVSPENDAVLVADYAHARYGLGGAANVARNLQLMGTQPALFGAVSDARVRHLLDDAGVGHHTPHPHVGRTPEKDRVVTSDGNYLLRVDTEAAACGMTDDYWRDYNSPMRAALRDVPRSRPAAVAVVSDYDKGLMSPAAVDALFEDVPADTLLVVDPGRHGDWGRYSRPGRSVVIKVNLRQALAHYERYRGTADNKLVAPFESVGEAQAFSPDALSRAAERVWANARACDYRFHALFLTAGPAGVAVAHDGLSRPYAARGPAVERPDPCGAGDTALAVIAHTMVNQFGAYGLAAAATNADKAARVACRHPGVYAVNAGDMNWDR